MSKDFSITVYFDGTGNNKYIDQAKDEQTNIVKLYDAQIAKKSDLSYNRPRPEQYQSSKYKNGEPEALYFDGVGSQKNDSIIKTFQGATGWGSGKRVDAAYKAIVEYHNKYPNEEVKINLVGFSRGAAQARDLSNTIIKKGIPNRHKKGKYLLEPGQPNINKLAIFDTVSSYGIATTKTHIGKDLTIHKNVKSTTHLVAANEYRKSFKLSSALNPKENNINIEERSFPGAHSQIGGGYKADILSAGPLSNMYNHLQGAGIKMQALESEDKKNIIRYNHLIVSKSDLTPYLIDSRGSKNNTFALEKGSLTPWRRQKEDFEHNVYGRELIHEKKEFKNSQLKNIFKNVRRKIKSNNILDKNNNKFLEKQNFKQTENDFNFDKIRTSLAKSRPDKDYFLSLNFKPVNISKNNTLENSELIKKSFQYQIAMKESKTNALKQYPELKSVYYATKKAEQALNQKNVNDKATRNNFINKVKQNAIAELSKDRPVPQINIKQRSTTKSHTRGAVYER